ncbi:hypothetical protein GCM10009647_091670 [Streptomyces sanglieri]
MHTAGRWVEMVTGNSELPRLRTECARRGGHAWRPGPFRARTAGGRALGQASATVDVGDTVPGHTDERQLYDCAIGEDGAV